LLWKINIHYVVLTTILKSSILLKALARRFVSFYKTTLRVKGSNTGAFPSLRLASLLFFLLFNERKNMQLSAYSFICIVSFF